MVVVVVGGVVVVVVLKVMVVVVLAVPIKKLFWATLNPHLSRSLKMAGSCFSFVFREHNRSDVCAFPAAFSSM